MYTVDQNIIPIPENSDQNIHLTHTHTHTHIKNLWHVHMIQMHDKELHKRHKH